MMSHPVYLDSDPKERAERITQLSELEDASNIAHITF